MLPPDSGRGDIEVQTFNASTFSDEGDAILGRKLVTGQCREILHGRHIRPSPEHGDDLSRHQAGVNHQYVRGRTSD